MTESSSKLQKQVEQSRKRLRLQSQLVAVAFLLEIIAMVLGLLAARNQPEDCKNVSIPIDVCIVGGVGIVLAIWNIVLQAKSRSFWGWITVLCLLGLNLLMLGWGLLAATFCITF